MHPWTQQDMQTHQFTYMHVYTHSERERSRIHIHCLQTMVRHQRASSESTLAKEFPPIPTNLHLDVRIGGSQIPVRHDKRMSYGRVQQCKALEGVAQYWPHSLAGKYRRANVIHRNDLLASPVIEAKLEQMLLLEDNAEGYRPNTLHRIATPPHTGTLAR